MLLMDKEVTLCICPPGCSEAATDDATQTILDKGPPLSRHVSFRRLNVLMISNYLAKSEVYSIEGSYLTKVLECLVFPIAVLPLLKFVYMDPTFPLVPIANFLAGIFILASLSTSMFHSRNVGVRSLAIWVTMMSFTTAVNSIIWANSVENVAPV